MKTTTVKAVHRIMFGAEALIAMGRKPGSAINPGEVFPCPDDQLAWLRSAGAIAAVKSVTAAEATTRAPVPTPVDDEAEHDGPPALEGMSADELREVGAALRLKFAKNMKPETMIAKIELARESQDDDNESGDEADDLV